MSSYNAAPYIGKAIECIIAQTYTNWELIISDDRSPDNSIEVVKNYLGDERIQLHVQEKNLGYVRNKNSAMKRATGDLITQLDCDDLCPANRIEKQVAVFEKYNDIKICGSRYMPVGINDEPLTQMKIAVYENNSFTEDTLITKPELEYPFWFPGLMWRKELFDEFGYFPEYFDIFYGDDHYWTMVVNSKYPIYFLKDSLYYYRINPTSITNVPNNPLKLISQDIIAEYYRQITETGTDWLREGKSVEANALPQRLLNDKKLMAKRYGMWAAKSIDNKKWSQAKDLLKKMFSSSVTDINSYRTLLYYIRSRYLS